VDIACCILQCPVVITGMRVCKPIDIVVSLPVLAEVGGGRVERVAQGESNACIHIEFAVFSGLPLGTGPQLVDSCNGLGKLVLPYLCFCLDEIGLTGAGHGHVAVTVSTLCRTGAILGLVQSGKYI